MASPRADFFALPGRPRPEGKLPARQVFLDPPYKLVDEPEERTRLFGTMGTLAGRWVAAGSLIVLHHRPIKRIEWPAGVLQEHDSRLYGNSQITLFRFQPGTR